MLRLPAWILGALFIVSAVIAILALRQNNQTMIELRNDVYQADQTGGDVESALGKLRAYVHSHINTDLSSGGNAIKPPIQLKYTYERLVAAEQKRVDSVNAKVYTDAQNHCQALHPASFSGRQRVPCVEQYVTANGVKAQAVPPALYQFDFVSPTWSPDLAGFSLLASIFLAIALVAALTLRRLRLS